MPKLPYDQIVSEANKLILKMTLAKDLKTINYWWDTYVAFLEASGWDPISFDKETAKRVDEGWEENKPITWN